MAFGDDGLNNFRTIPGPVVHGVVTPKHPNDAGPFLRTMLLDLDGTVTHTNGTNSNRQRGNSGLVYTDDVDEAPPRIAPAESAGPDHLHETHGPSTVMRLRSRRCNRNEQFPEQKRGPPMPYLPVKSRCCNAFHEGECCPLLSFQEG